MDEDSQRTWLSRLQDINELPLGLPMKRSESFLKLIQSIIEGNVDIVGSHHDEVKKEVYTPSNFPITTLSIGNWKREASSQGDMTIRFYYRKRKVVWEFLNGPLKSKMEVSWSDITAIEAAMNPNQPGFLRVELKNPPFFFRELPPQPKTRVTWEPFHDFTGGQALHCRIYEATFPPGALDKPYEKLLLSDTRLAQLSRRLTNSTIIAASDSLVAPSSCVVGSSIQKPIVVSDHEELYEYNDIFIDNEPTFAGPPSSDQKPIAVSDYEELYEYNDIFIDNEPTFAGPSSSDQNLYVVPPSSWPPIFQHGPSEAQYLGQNGQQSFAAWDDFMLE